MNELPITDPFTWLLGEWQGRGEGGFPGMAPFYFEDQVFFQQVADTYVEPILRVEETAWLTSDDTREFKHWEVGFLKPTSNNHIQFHCCHNTGRHEIMSGQITNIKTEKRSFQLTLTSIFIKNDPELTVATQSVRQFDLQGQELLYTLFMSTARTRRLTPHLSIQLHKVSG